MGKINLLSFEVANLIAAGEVVDRPASAVKELLENAIDAKATRITLEIQRGGVSFIRVEDNGCGMEKEDLRPAITRHSTSKIKTAADLGSITTLGFRGEALAAIAAVSRMRIYSKQAGEKMGALLESEGGRNVTVTDTGCREGTTIIVEDLFFNVPARRKFLKKDSTEAIAIGAVVEKIALSHAEICFKFISDGEIKFMTSGSGDLRETIWALYGRDTAKRSLKTDRSENGIRISGFVSEPDLHRPNRNTENFFINGRYIKSKTASAAIEQAYQSKIPHDRFPFCVLNIELNPAAVDVNVHPAKLEVKFANEKIIFDAVYYAVLSALEAAAVRPELTLTKAQAVEKAEEDISIRTSQLSPYAARAAKYPRTNVTAEDSAFPEKQVHVSDWRDKYIESQARVTVNPTGFSPEQIRTSPIPLDRPQPKAEQVTVTDAIRSLHIGDREKSRANENAPQPNQKTQANPPVQPTITTDIELTDFPANQQSTGRSAQVNQAGQSIPAGAKSGSNPYEAIDSFDINDVPEYFIIGEAFNCYVIVQIGEILLMIDKHAAHERIIFDELCRKMHARMNGKDGGRGSQMLLAPIELTLLPAEIEALGEYEEKIRALGYDYTFEQKSAASFALNITAIPVDLEIAAASELFSTLVTRLSESTASVESASTGFFETRLWQASCKAAIKGGRIYDMAHIKWICDRLLVKPQNGGGVIRTCPHGRPVAFEIKKSSIDRQFARLN